MDAIYKQYVIFAFVNIRINYPLNDKINLSHTKGKQMYSKDIINTNEFNCSAKSLMLTLLLSNDMRR